MPSAVTDSRTQAVIESMSEKSQELAASAKRKRFQFRRRTKMPFRVRLLLFSVIFGVLLFAYLLDFFAGGALGPQVNSWTDSMTDSAIHAFCATMADITGSDWSGRELALSRLLLMGPVSYILFAFAIALITAGITALVWSRYATKHALDDGTSNFLPND